jgi:hypothetical protein
MKGRGDGLKGIIPVLNQYPITIRSIVPVQDDVFLVEASQGNYCLKCANKGEHKMLFIYSALNQPLSPLIFYISSFTLSSTAFNN